MPEDRVGFITTEQENFLGNLADQMIDASNWKYGAIIESVDGAFFTLVIRTVDNQLGDRVPEDWKTPLSTAIDAAMVENWGLVKDTLATLVNKKVDIPGIDEASEQMMFSFAINMIEMVLLAYVFKKEAEEASEEG